MRFRIKNLLIVTAVGSIAVAIATPFLSTLDGSTLLQLLVGMVVYLLAMFAAWWWALRRHGKEQAQVGKSVLGAVTGYSVRSIGNVVSAF